MAQPERRIATAWLLLCLAPAVPAQEPAPRTVATLVGEEPTDGHAELLAALRRALEHHRDLAPGPVVRFRRTGEGTVPPAAVLRSYCGRADVLVCIGFDALRPLLGPEAPPPRVPVWSLGAEGLWWLPGDNPLLPGLGRLRGGVAGDVALGPVLELARSHGLEARDVGVLVDERVPRERLTRALVHARELGMTLHVERLGDLRDATAAVQRLIDAGAGLVLTPCDRLALASSRGRLALPGLRARLLRAGVPFAAMGGDDYGDLRPAPDRHRMVQRLIALLAADRPGDPAPPLEPAPVARPTPAPAPGNGR